MFAHPTPGSAVLRFGQASPQARSEDMYNVSWSRTGQEEELDGLLDTELVVVAGKTAHCSEVETTAAWCRKSSQQPQTDVTAVARPPKTICTRGAKKGNDKTAGG